MENTPPTRPADKCCFRQAGHWQLPLQPASLTPQKISALGAPAIFFAPPPFVFVLLNRRWGHEIHKSTSKMLVYGVFFLCKTIECPRVNLWTHVFVYHWLSIYTECFEWKIHSTTCFAQFVADIEGPVPLNLPLWARPPRPCRITSACRTV